MGIFLTIEPWDTNTYGSNIKTLRVLVECEKGSANKYEYDDKLDRMVIVRELHPKHKYIYNYGCIPRTLAGDGDNLDAIVIGKEIIRSGTLVNVFPIAVVRTIDRGEQDDKIICSPYYTKHGKVNVRKIVKYLRNYKYPDNDTTQVTEVEDAEAAVRTIEKSIKRFLGE